MDTYLVHLTATPSPGAEEFGQLGGAHVHAYVQADSLADAAQRALAHVMDRRWVVAAQLGVLLMTPERIAAMDATDTAAYRRARAEGLYSFFIAWPVQDRPDDQIDIRPLADPDTPSDTHH